MDPSRLSRSASTTGRSPDHSSGPSPAKTSTRYSHESTSTSPRSPRNHPNFRTRLLVRKPDSFERLIAEPSGSYRIAVRRVQNRPGCGRSRSGGEARGRDISSTMARASCGPPTARSIEPARSVTGTSRKGHHTTCARERAHVVLDLVVRREADDHACGGSRDRRRVRPQALEPASALVALGAGEGAGDG
jgi:hypothetical protein